MRAKRPRCATADYYQVVFGVGESCSHRHRTIHGAYNCFQTTDGAVAIIAVWNRTDAIGTEKLHNRDCERLTEREIHTLLRWQHRGGRSELTKEEEGADRAATMQEAEYGEHQFPTLDVCRRFELVLRLTNPDVEAIELEDLHKSFCDVVDDPLIIRLLLDVHSNEDRLALAFHLLPFRVALEITCGFVEHPLRETDHVGYLFPGRSYQERNREAIASLKAYLAGSRNDAQLILDTWPLGYSYVPTLNPGIKDLARAAADPQNGPRHLYHAAKKAREYHADRFTRPSTRKRFAQATRQELRWQVSHMYNSVKVMLSQQPDG